MSLDVSAVIPKGFQEIALWLGKLPRWFVTFSVEPDKLELPKTGFKIDWDVLKNAPGANDVHVGNIALLRKMHETKQGALPFFFFEAAGRLLADGPKLFRPTVEQFESMEHVKIELPPQQFRSPYPALVIEVPLECRRRLAAEVGLRVDQITPQILVRSTMGEKDQGQFVYVIMPMPGEDFEESFLFSDNPHNPTVESILDRIVLDNQEIRGSMGLPEALIPHKKIAARFGHAALNLCLMLTHFGSRVTGPPNPVATKKKKGKEKNRVNTEYSIVELTRTIVVRKTQNSTGNPHGLGVGSEQEPTWRKGHWRAYPGFGAARALGQEVPLLFVRPCLVRRDRFSGDLANTSVTYISEG